MFDWIHSGLADATRQTIHQRLLTHTEYRMACMDAWGSTPNLNFKPIFMVAFAGMALRDEHVLEWGWQHHRRQGNFYSMMDRMLMTFEDDRIGRIHFDRQYTAQLEYVVTVPGKWVAPGGSPRWKRIIAVDESSERFDAEPAREAKVLAAELAFPDGEWNRAFSFHPARSVDFGGAGMKFTLRRPLPDGARRAWSVGFSRPGTLLGWRSR